MNRSTARLRFETAPQGMKPALGRLAAQGFPVGLYTLDQFDLTERRAGVGLASGAGLAALDLRPNLRPTEIHLVEDDRGAALARPLVLSGEAMLPGVRVTVEALAGLSTLLLVRAGGRPVGLTPAGPSAGAERPERLTAFVAGTLIDTPDGPSPVEDLAIGDRVTTLANGSRALVWVARRRVLPVDMLAQPGLRPLSLPAGSAGNDRPLLVSPRQRMLIDDWRAEVYFGEDRVLAASEALADARDRATALPQGGVDYVILLCDRHEILVANGALSESFYPDEAALSALTPVEMASLAKVASRAELIRRRAAYPIVRNAEAKALRLSA